MKKTRAVFGWLLTAATLLLAGLLIFECLKIYVIGNTPQNNPAPGVYIQPVFSGDTVTEHFQKIAWSFWIWLGVLIFCLFLRLLPENMEKPALKLSKSIYKPEKKSCNQKKAMIVRCVFLIISVLLLVFGVLNGGIRDVFVKAINICTECIGLG